MFYPGFLLMKHYCLRMAWIAATYPIKLTRWPSFLKVSLRNSCEELAKRINRDSADPNKKLSLRSSITLLRGITSIYRRQVTALLNDYINLKSNIPKSFIKPPKTPKPKKSTPARPEPVEEVMSHVVNIDDITLREDVIFPEAVPIDQHFGDDQCPLVFPIDQPNAVEEYIAGIGAEQTVVEPPPDLINDPEVNTTKHPDIVIPPSPVVDVQPATRKRVLEEEDISLQLEEISAAQVPAAKRRNSRKNIKKIDKNISISVEDMREQLRNHNVHLRCQRPLHDIYIKDSRRDAEDLLNNPAMSTRMDNRLNNNFKRNLRPILTTHKRTERSMEVVVGEVNNTVIEVSSILPMEQAAIPDISLPMAPMQMDLVPSTSMTMHDPSASILAPEVSVSMLAPDVTVNMTNVDMTEGNITKQRITSSEEPMLGSEDRTKVSLGDENSSVVEVRTKRDQEWGTHGLMMKIIDAKAAGLKKITISSIMEREMGCGTKMSRVIAAKAFHSLLFLKASEFIELVKNDKLELENIKIGKRLKKK